MVNKTSFLQQWLESVWYDGNRPFSRLLLTPLSWLYSTINTYQRISHVKNQKKIPCPVVVVGNITVGGTGKTPLTIHLVKHLQQLGYKPAIITRGYGGKATEWPQVVSATSDAIMVGDEAVLMAQRTGALVYAGANRLASIEQLLATHECDVIVSDDGMQHYKLARDIQIAVIDGKRQLGNGYCLPAGPLREKKERLHTCDFVVVNGKNNIDASYFEMTLSGDTVINLATLEEKPLSDFANQHVQALTGIGNPQRFYSTLKNANLQVNEYSFPDHYAFQKEDMHFSDDSIVIMTEKDAVKCRSLIGAADNFWYLPVDAKLDKTFDDAFISRFKAINSAYISS